MGITITTDSTGLMKQAPYTIEYYLIEVVIMLDKQFGKGYAEKNPNLVASLVESCNNDFIASSNSLSREEIAELYAFELSKLTDILEDGLENT